MEDLGKLIDDLDKAKEERKVAYELYGKRKKAFKKLKQPPREYERRCADDTLFFGGIGALLGGFVGACACKVCERPIISQYLSKPENADKLQELFDATGYDSIREVSTYLMGDDGVARVLFESCGARDYFLTTTVGAIAVTALVGFGMVALPYVYEQAKCWSYNRNEAKFKKSRDNYQELNNKCETLENQIQTTIYNSWDEYKANQVSESTESKDEGKSM